MTNEELKNEIDQLRREMKLIYASSTIPYEVDQAFRQRFRDIILDIPDELQDAPLDSISAPTGGLTVDTEARNAINTIITRLESLGLVNPN